MQYIYIFLWWHWGIMSQYCCSDDLQFHNYILHNFHSRSILILYTIFIHVPYWYYTQFPCMFQAVDPHIYYTPTLLSNHNVPSLSQWPHCTQNCRSWWTFFQFPIIISLHCTHWPPVAGPAVTRKTPRTRGTEICSRKHVLKLCMVCCAAPTLWLSMMDHGVSIAAGSTLSYLYANHQFNPAAMLMVHTQHCCYGCSSVSDIVNPAAMDAPVSVTLSTLQLWMLQCQWHWGIHSCRADSVTDTGASIAAGLTVSLTLGHP